MKFGVREIANVVFKANHDHYIGNKLFKKGQPVLYIDTAKTATMEGAATSVYATGGRGNTRLITWEGEKTLTFTVEDAVLSPIGFSILSGAGLFKGNDKVTQVHVHTTTKTTISQVDDSVFIDLTDALAEGEMVCPTAPIFAVMLDAHGDLTGNFLPNLTVDPDNSARLTVVGSWHDSKPGVLLVGEDKLEVAIGDTVFVDYYILKQAVDVSEMSIEAEKFGGSYYVEADTLFRRQGDNVDLPAVLTFPNVKVQSNFTFTMASSGDPSTFTFTMDAMPGYTYFNKTNKVLCVMQVVEDTKALGAAEVVPYMPHPTGFDIEESKTDSTPASSNEGIATTSVQG